nr:hypothetical protein [uncultured Acetatifactor sp.]
MNHGEAKRRQAEEVTNILTLITVLITGQLTGNKGIAYVAVAVEVYALVWTAVSGNLSDTLGRLLRGRKNRGQYGNIGRLRRNAMFFQVALGLAGSLILLFFAETIAEGIFGIRYSTFIIRVLSPIILLRTVSAVLLGYFQGDGLELPRAISGILRQIFILGFGLLFSGMMKNYGEKVSNLLMQENFTFMHSGAGIAIAVCLAEIFIIIFLIVIFRGSQRAERRNRKEERFATETFPDSVRYLYVSRWPLLVTGVLKTVPFAAGLIFFVREAEDENAAALEYGLYAGKYLAICGIIVCLISAVSLPVTARIFTCLRSGENRFAKKVFQSGVHICLIHGIFSSVFLAFMGEQIAGLLCPENEETLQKMFAGGSTLVLFTALACYFGRFLQITGKKYLVLGAVGMADIVFFFFAIILLQVSKAGILALVYGGMAGMAVLCVVLGLFAYRQLRTQADWLGILLVPLGAGGVAGLVTMLLGRTLSPYLGSLVTLLAGFAVSTVIYWILLLVLRNFKEHELEAIPGGRLIEKIGQLFHIF